MAVLKRKSQIEYEMNSIEKYIKDGDFDDSLQQSWNKLQEEYKEVENHLAMLENPATSDLITKKLELQDEVARYEAEISKLNRQISDIEKRLPV